MKDTDHRSIVVSTTDDEVKRDNVELIFTVSKERHVCFLSGHCLLQNIHLLLPQ